MSIRDIKITIVEIPYDFPKELIDTLQSSIIEKAKENRFLISPEDIRICILYGLKWSDISNVRDIERRRIKIHVSGPFTQEAERELESCFLGVLFGEARKYFKGKNEKKPTLK